MQSTYDLNFFKKDLIENKNLLFNLIKELKNLYTKQEKYIKGKIEELKNAGASERRVIMDELAILSSIKKPNPGFESINKINDINDPYFFFCTDDDNMIYISSMNINHSNGEKEFIPFTNKRAAKIRYNEEYKNRYRIDIKDGEIISIKKQGGNYSNISPIDSNNVIGIHKLKEEIGEITGGKKKVGVGDISKLLKSEQNEIMMAPSEGITLISGVAGSGKTNILLHRIQYLLWEQPGKKNNNDVLFHQNNMLFLCFSDSLQKYISTSIKGKFPNIEVKTVDQRFLEIFNEYFPSAKYNIRQDDKEHPFSLNDAKNLIAGYFNKYAETNSLLGMMFGNRINNEELEEFKNGLCISKNIGRGKYNIKLNSGLLDKIFGEKITFYTRKHILTWIYLLSITTIEKDSRDTFKLNIGRYGYIGLKAGNAQYTEYYFDKKIYDHIFIDEVQDLSKIQIHIINGFHNNSMTIAGDESQILKNTNIDSDISTFFDIKIANRYSLTTSHRNSQQTALFANQFLKNITIINKIENISFKGLLPIVKRVDDCLGEYQYLYDKINDLQSNEPEATIAVLYPKKESARTATNVLNMLGNEKGTIFNCYFAYGENRDFSNKIHISEYRQAKGLEFDYIFICGLTEFDQSNNKNKERILYTLITRGVKRDFVIYKSGYRDEYHIPIILKGIDKNTYDLQI